MIGDTKALAEEVSKMNPLEKAGIAALYQDSLDAHVAYKKAIDHHRGKESPTSQKYHDLTRKSFNMKMFIDQTEMVLNLLRS